MADIRIEVTRVIGSVKPFIAGQPVDVDISITDAIGPVSVAILGAHPYVRISISEVLNTASAFIEKPTIRLRPAVSRIIGTVSTNIIGLAPSIKFYLTRAIGSVRIVTKGTGTYWQPVDYVPPPDHPEEPYLPLIEMTGYRWQNEPNIVSTQMASGVVRQRQKRSQKLRQLNVQLKLTCRQLTNLEELLTKVNSSWFRWPVMTGQSNGLIEEHTVRITDIVGYSADGDMYTVTLAVEAVF